MKIKKDNALAGIDIIIAIIAVTIFSTLIISMIYNNIIENVKLKKEALAMIFITEIFENVGIEAYDNEVYNNIGTEYTQITEANILVPQEAIDNFTVEMAVTAELDGVTNNENILKKVQVKLTYQIDDKTYIRSMQRMKIKE